MTVARRILLHVALGVFFVVAVVTAVTYERIYQALTTSGLKQLETYVSERAEREEARFQQIQSNLVLVRGQFLKRLASPPPPEIIEQKFNYWYRRYDDGAWRSREQFKDARKTSSMWADKEWPCTPEMRQAVVIAQDLCDEMLPGWVDIFPSYYLQFPGPGYVNVGVDTKIPDWSWKMPAHYETAGVEWIALAAPEEPPTPDVFSWTGVQEDSATVGLFVCVYLPVYRDGIFVGSVGHNMPLDGSLSHAIESDIPGASHFIFRTDGRLIAHPERNNEIAASKGMLSTQSCGDATVARLYEIASSHPERRLSGYDEANGTYYSFARLAGPEWVYVTIMPKRYLQAQASSSARWVLWSGLLSLALVLGLTFAVLQTNVARPLRELTEATKMMSTGDDPPSLTPRADELGELAQSFRNMVKRVAEREADLRQLNLVLENRVAERTADLHQSLAREREAGEIKSNFVSLVSHEFRTPLGVIMSATDVLQRYFERLAPEKRSRHLDMIFRSTKQLAGLIDEVLLLSRVEEGRLRFTPMPIELEKLCRTICDELQSATGAACPIDFHARSSLEGAVSDEAAVRHIVSNLLSNACKYSEPGRPVQFLAERCNGNVVFTISDQGIGIPPEDQTRLFNTFTRGGNVGARPGTGLGLVIVQRCVKLHGGELRLESELDRGTTVTVSLPVFATPPATPSQMS